MSEVIEVTLLNWSKYNSKSDKLRHPYWFKIHKKIIYSSSLFGLNHGQKWFWIYLLCEAAENFSPKISINLKKSVHVTFLSNNEVVEAIEKLEQNGTLTVNRQATDSKLTVNRQPRRKEKRRLEEKEERRIEKNREETTINPPKDFLAATIKTPGSISFDSYAKAYKEKYNEAPVRNKKINTQFKYLAERLGLDAPMVAEFYLSHTEYLYVKSMHSVDLLLRDAEKIRTEWKTGNKMNSNKAKTIETKEHYVDQMRMIDRGEV